MSIAVVGLPDLRVAAAFLVVPTSHRTQRAKSYFADAVIAPALSGRVTFHSLRHLLAVRLLTRGVPTTVVSELLVHDINLTVKRYGRFSSDAKVKWGAVKVLDVT